MLLFTEDQQDYVVQEIKDFGGEILGQCTMTINKDKATFLVQNRKKPKEKQEDDLDVEQLQNELASESLFWYAYVSNNRSSIFGEMHQPSLFSYITF